MHNFSSQNGEKKKKRILGRKDCVIENFKTLKLILKMFKTKISGIPWSILESLTSKLSFEREITHVELSAGCPESELMGLSVDEHRLRLAELHHHSLAVNQNVAGRAGEVDS